MAYLYVLHVLAKRVKVIITIFKGKRIPIQMSLKRQFAIRNELLYSGFVISNAQIFFVQKISFATFEVSIDDFIRDTLVWATAYVVCNVKLQLYAKGLAWSRGWGAGST